MTGLSDKKYIFICLTARNVGGRYIRWSLYLVVIKFGDIDRNHLLKVDGLKFDSSSMQIYNISDGFNLGGTKSKTIFYGKHYSSRIFSFFITWETSFCLMGHLGY